MLLTASEDEVLLSGAGPRDRNWSDAERSEWDVVFDRVDTEDVTDILKNLKALVSKVMLGTLVMC